MSAKLLYTTAEVAAWLDVDPAHVRHLAASMGMERRGRDWFFSPADLRRLRNRPDARRERPLDPAPAPDAPPTKRKRK